MTAPSDHTQLQISCPSCSQRFKVGSELKGRVVECGSCESRFEITDDVIVRGAKFYPGERKTNELKRFQRVEGEVIPSIPARPAGVLPQQEKGYFSPISKVSPLQLVMGWVGALLILGLVYLLGFQNGGVLQKLPIATKAAIAIVGGIVGLALIAYANPRNRRKTMTVASVFAVVLLAIPFVFSSKPLPPVSQEIAELPPERSAPVEVQDDGVEALRARIGTEPLEEEIRRMAESGTKLRSYGIWLRDLSDSNLLSVRDYVLRSTGADPASNFYPRDGDYLMVVRGVDMTLEQLAAVTSKFGVNQKLHPELQIVETRVEGAVFVQGSLDKLKDKSNPAFYSLNKRELESIELDRVSQAVNRLAEAEPTIYRDDITRSLIELLGVEKVNFPGDVCKALMVWAEDPVPAGNAAYARMVRLREANQSIPRDMVALLAKAKNEKALPIVEALWHEDPTMWERLLGDFGPLAEPGILKQFPDMQGTIRHSAARVLERVGTRASLPILEAALPTAEPELVVLIENATKAIKNRL